MTSPAGNEFAISTGEGVSIYSKNKTSFASIPLNEAATPQNAISKVKNEEFGSALVIALTLNDENLIREIIENIPLKAIEVLALSLPSNIVLPLLSFISRYLTCHTGLLFYFIIVYKMNKSRSNNNDHQLCCNVFSHIIRFSVSLNRPNTPKFIYDGVLIC